MHVNILGFQSVTIFNGTNWQSFVCFKCWPGPPTKYFSRSHELRSHDIAVTWITVTWYCEILRSEFRVFFYHRFHARLDRQARPTNLIPFSLSLYLKNNWFFAKNNLLGSKIMRKWLICMDKPTKEPTIEPFREPSLFNESNRTKYITFFFDIH